MLPSLSKVANNAAVVRITHGASTVRPVTDAALPEFGEPVVARSAQLPGIQLKDEERRAGDLPEVVALEVVPTLGMRRRSSVAEAIMRDPTAVDKLCIETPLTARSVQGSRMSMMSTRSSLSLPLPESDTPSSIMSGSSIMSTSSIMSGSTPIETETKDMRFDLCTILFWFDSIDTDRSGKISKQEWMQFLRSNPHIDAALLHGKVGARHRCNKDSLEGFLQGREQAAQLKRRMRILRELDTNGDGVLGWEEFVDFFRRSGNLLELSPASPKYRIYELVQTMREAPDNVTENDKLELRNLIAKHLSASQRSSLCPTVVQQLPRSLEHQTSGAYSSCAHRVRQDL